MAFPADYTRLKDFTAEIGSNTDHVNLNAELDNAIAYTLGVLDSLKLIQRSDGALANQSVGADQLAASAVALFNAAITPRGTWVTTTAYAVNDLVIHNGATYLGMEAHTSGAFATDLAAGKWQLFVPKTIAPPTLFQRITPAEGLLIERNATTPDDILDVAAFAITLFAGFNSLDQVTVGGGGGASVDITASGLSGLDTGSVANDNWYYIHYIYNSATGNAGPMFSLSATAPVMPSGFDYQGLLGAWYYTGDALRPGVQVDREHFRDEATVHSWVDTTQTNESIDLSADIPPALTRTVRLRLSIIQTAGEGYRKLNIGPNVAMAATGLSYIGHVRTGVSGPATPMAFVEIPVITQSLVLNSSPSDATGSVVLSSFTYR